MTSREKCQISEGEILFLERNGTNTCAEGKKVISVLKQSPTPFS